jgi:hypothetical protein
MKQKQALLKPQNRNKLLAHIREQFRLHTSNAKLPKQQPVPTKDQHNQRGKRQRKPRANVERAASGQFHFSPVSQSSKLLVRA